MRTAVKIARQRLRVLERGIAGDIDRRMSPEQRAEVAEDRMAAWVHEMAKGRWPELLPMYLSVLQDLAKAEAEAPGSGGAGGEHLAALAHFGGGDVPDTSLGRPGADQAQADADPGEHGPPDSESDGRPGEPVGQLALPVIDAWPVVAEGPGFAAGERRAGERGGRGRPPPPPPGAPSPPLSGPRGNS